MRLTKNIRKSIFWWDYTFFSHFLKYFQDGKVKSEDFAIKIENCYTQIVIITQKLFAEKRLWRQLS